MCFIHLYYFELLHINVLNPEETLSLNIVTVVSLELRYSDLVFSQPISGLETNNIQF